VDGRVEVEVEVVGDGMEVEFMEGLEKVEVVMEEEVEM